MATEIWVNFGSGNGLLPDGTKPLPESVLTDHQRSPVTYPGAFSQEMPQSSITKICLKITYLEFHSNFPGASELMISMYGIKLPACTTASRTTVATIAKNSSANLKFVWLIPNWCYWVLTMLHNQDYQNPNIKSHSFKFLLWKPVSVSCKVVQWMYTGNSSALCLGFPSHRTWVDSGSSN